MLSAIVHEMTGFVTIKIDGADKERFINLAVRSGIHFWHYHRDGESYFISVRSSDFKKLRPIKRRCKIKVRIVKKRGVPFKLLPFKKRPGLLVGLAVGILMIGTLSGRVWVLSASGSSIYSQEEILAAAEKSGVFYSCKFDAFDPVLSANRIMQNLSKASWVSVNTDGVFVDIAVQDGLQKPKVTDQKTVKNIIASETGVIKSIEAQDGIPVVKVGEAVKKGDLCITGIWEDDRGITHFASSRGKIMIEVKRELTTAVSLSQTVNEFRAQTVKRQLNIFGLKVPFSFVHVSAGDYELSETENPLYIMNVRMPISLTTQKYAKLSKTKRTITAAEAEERGLYKLDKMLNAILGESGKKNSEDIQVVSDGLTVFLTAKYSLLIDAAEEQTILCE